MHNTNLEHLTLVVPVLDLAHVVGTIKNLAAIRAYLPIDRLDIELRVADRFLDNTIDQQKQIDALTKDLTQSTAALDAAILKEKE